MRLAQLYQFIVPLTFLAIWALTSLFNREAQPLPPRAGRPPGPPGPAGPRPSPGSASSDWRTETIARESAPVRTSSQPGTHTGPRTDGRMDDGIRVIEVEQRRPIPPPPPGPRIGTPAPRRPGKARPAAKETPRRAEPATPRTLSGSMEHQSSIAKEIGPALVLSPLHLAPSLLLTQASSSVAKIVEEARAHTAGQEAVTLAEIRAQLLVPSRVRETLILKEILEPPLALRNRPIGPRR
jgi:hypothetical protein